MITTATIYDRGIALYESGAVSKTTVKGVFNVGSYLVDTRRDFCACAYHEHHPDIVCKHLVATLRKMLDDLLYR